MEWGSWGEFWNMGGAAWFVWGSYGVTALLLAVELLAVLRRRKQTVNKLLRLKRAAPTRRGGVAEESVE